MGRTKELIVRFGFDAYPGEVEAVLNAHPGVVRSAVIGQLVEGVEQAEEVVAFVQPLPNSSLTPNFRTPDIPLKSGQNWGFSRVGCGPKPVRFLSLQL